MTTQKINLETQQSVLKRWLTPNELEAEYGFSTSWQAKARMTSSKSTLPYSKVGRIIRYDRVAIEQWLENHTIVGGK